MATIIVTGGTRGIGLGIVKKFLSENHHVITCGRTALKTDPFNNPRFKFVQGDVSDIKTHQRLAEEALKITRKLDHYINAAGISQWRPVEEVSEDFWNLLINTNLKGTFLGCQVAAKNLSIGGSIMNISSLAGKRGSANNSVYCATKFGVNGITQALAKELGPKGIRVNAVCPVYVKTETLMDALKEKNSPTEGKNVEEYLTNFAKSQSALLKLPTSSDVAEAVYWMCMGSQAITGQCVNVDCGVLPQ